MQFRLGADVTTRRPLFFTEMSIRAYHTGRRWLFHSDRPRATVPLSNKALGQVTLQDLQGLITAGATESPRLDFKRDTYGGADADRRELCYDVASFANGAGGDIVIGMDEANGAATALVPHVGDADAEILRLESILTNGIQPRIAGLQVGKVVVPGGHALIIRIPRSWNAPHMVTLGGQQKFYVRGGAGKHMMDIQQIRNAVLGSETRDARIRAFRDERLGRIMAGDAPVAPFENGGFLMVHIVPLASFEPGRVVDLREVAQDPHRIRPLRAGGFNRRWNADGLVAYHRHEVQGYRIATYTQVYRSGIIEMVMSPVRADMRLEFGWQGRLIGRLQELLVTLNNIGAAPPYVLMLSLVGVRGTRITTDAHAVDVQLIDRDVLILPDAVIEELGADIAKSIRPAYDALWNASGWPRCLGYHAQTGAWTWGTEDG